MPNTPSTPLVYACSGCSNVAQLANNIALSLDQHGDAEMSCIAGVGGHVPKLVKTAKSGRPIIALDGCALACVANCLKKHGIKANNHIILSELGLKKRYKTAFNETECETITTDIRNRIAAS